MPFKIASIEDAPVIEHILAEAGKHGETMVQGGSLGDFFETGFFMLEENGHGFFWAKTLDGLSLEGHTTFLPRFRGLYAKNMALEAMRQVFSELSVERIYTKCKEKHKYVAQFCSWVGFKNLGWIGDEIVFECSLESYVLQDASLEAEAVSAGFPLPEVCPMEQAQFAGFFVLCCKKGLFMKGRSVYNRMAFLLGWEPLLIKSNEPILFTVGDRQFSPTVVVTGA